MFNTIWESYPGNTIFDLSTNITRDLENLYMEGKGKKKWQITVEKAYCILVDTTIKYDWLQILTPSVAKIK